MMISDAHKCGNLLLGAARTFDADDRSFDKLRIVLARLAALLLSPIPGDNRQQITEMVEELHGDITTLLCDTPIVVAECVGFATIEEALVLLTEALCVEAK